LQHNHVNDVVTQGDNIGLQGNTGKYSSGSHLHFGLYLLDPSLTDDKGDRSILKNNEGNYDLVRLKKQAQRSVRLLKIYCGSKSNHNR